MMFAFSADMEVPWFVVANGVPRPAADASQPHAAWPESAKFHLVKSTFAVCAQGPYYESYIRHMSKQVMNGHKKAEGPG